MTKGSILAPILASWPSLLLQALVMGGALIGVAYQGGGQAEALRADVRAIGAQLDTVKLDVNEVKSALATVNAIDRRVSHIESTRDTPRVDDLLVRVRVLEREVDVIKARLDDRVGDL